MIQLLKGGGECHLTVLYTLHCRRSASNVDECSINVVRNRTGSEAVPISAHVGMPAPPALMYGVFSGYPV